MLFYCLRLLCILPRNYRIYSNKNFCKEPKQTKFWRVQTYHHDWWRRKKSLVFLACLKPSTCCALGVLLQDIFLMDAFHWLHCNIIHDLRLDCYVYVHIRKRFYCLRFFFFISICMYRDRWFNPERMMTDFKHYQLSTKLEQTTLVNFFAITKNTKKNLPSFHSCKVYNSLEMTELLYLAKCCYPSHWSTSTGLAASWTRKRVETWAK